MTDHAAHAEPMPARPKASPKRTLREQVADLRARFDALPRNQRWMVIGVLAVNIVGDWLRDRFNPKLRSLA